MIRRMLIVVGGLSGAVGASQAPEFMQQYTQRLGGAVQELSRVIDRFDADAASEGLPLDTAFERYKTSPDSFLQKRGVSMEQTFDRYNRIAAHRREWADASAIRRPMLFWQYHDRTLLDGTVQDYRPAVPTTAEGAAYAFGGFVLGGGLMALLLWPLGWLGRGRRTASTR